MAWANSHMKKGSPSSRPVCGTGSAPGMTVRSRTASTHSIPGYMTVHTSEMVWV